MASKFHLFCLAPTLLRCRPLHHGRPHKCLLYSQRIYVLRALESSKPASLLLVMCCGSCLMPRALHPRSQSQFLYEPTPTRHAGACRAPTLNGSLLSMAKMFDLASGDRFLSIAPAPVASTTNKQKPFDLGSFLEVHCSISRGLCRDRDVSETTPIAFPQKPQRLYRREIYALRPIMALKRIVRKGLCYLLPRNF